MFVFYFYYKFVFIFIAASVVIFVCFTRTTLTQGGDQGEPSGPGVLLLGPGQLREHLGREHPQRAGRGHHARGAARHDPGRRQGRRLPRIQKVLFEVVGITFTKRSVLHCLLQYIALLCNVFQSTVDVPRLTVSDFILCFTAHRELMALWQEVYGNGKTSHK